jgi:hypothetical protein
MVASVTAPQDVNSPLSDCECPHCHKPFDASVDMLQLPRLQGAKCPHCRLFVPLRLLDKGKVAVDRL